MCDVGKLLNITYDKMCYRYHYCLSFYIHYDSSAIMNIIYIEYYAY